MATKTALDDWLGQQGERPIWLALYQEVLAEQGVKPTGERWDWRKCLYVAWRCAPAKARWPATLDELASFMGLRNTATIRHWRLKDSRIEERIKTLRVALVDEHVSDLIAASIDCALNDAEKGHQDRKMLLEIAGIYKPRQISQVEGGDKPLIVKDDSLDDEQRAERIAAILDRARARRAGQAAEE